MRAMRKLVFGIASVDYTGCDDGVAAAHMSKKTASVYIGSKTFFCEWRLEQ